MFGELLEIVVDMGAGIVLAIPKDSRNISTMYRSIL